MANNTLAYGFQSVAQLMAQRVSTIGVDIISRAITESSAEYTRQLNALLGLLAERTTNAKETYLLPGSGTLQPVDEFGIPLPVIPSGSYDIAFPIQGGATAYGRNRITSVLETAAEINRDQLEAERMDADWMIRHALAALLDNGSWTYADPLLGGLTIEPLANNDSVTYVRSGGSASTANHYVAQTAAVADATNPFDTIWSTLTVYPSNKGQRIVSFVADAQVSDVEGLADFVPVRDPDVQVGSGSDQLVTNGTGLLSMGDVVLGKVGRIWVVNWHRLPANYILSVVDGRPPLAMREYPDERLQGLFPEIHSPDGARLERRYLRYCGFGVRNRISAMVTQVEGGDTTYDVPSGYSTPLAV